MTSREGNLTFIDTHTHLDDEQFADDLGAVVERAIDAGIARIINIGYEPDRWKTTIGLSRSFPQISFTLGLHPSESELFTPRLIDELGSLVQSSGASAIGEIGLDLFRVGPSLDLQRRSFEAQLTLARDLDFPVVIHQRAAEEELFDVLSRASADVQCVLHSFEGNQKLVELGINRGYHFGIGGLMTRARSAPLRELIKQIPISQLVLETDSPYLMPAGIKGKRNEPSNIPVIATALADLLEVPVSDVADTTTRNAIEIFRLGSPVPVAATMT